MKKLLSIILAFLLLVGTIPTTALPTVYASEVISGSCGENVTYTFDYTTGELVLSGSGPMADYDYLPKAPYTEFDIKSIVIEEGITSIGDKAFYKCKNITNITIPYGVLSIGDHAFASCNNLESVIIPDSVICIDDNAFWGCDSLESITIPDSVTTIGSGTFSACDNLKYVDLGNGLITIGDSAFSSCDKIQAITIPDSVIAINPWTFYHCDSLKNVTIGNSVTTIGEEAFYLCLSLEKLNIPASVTTIEDDVFNGCRSLYEITVDEDNQTFSNDEHGVLFNKDKTELIYYPSGKKDSSYKIPDSVKVIGASAFLEAYYLKNVELPENLKIIEDYAFGMTFAFEEIYLSEKVEKVGSAAFYTNPFLKKIYIEGMSTDLTDYGSFGFTEIFVKNISRDDFVDIFNEANESNNEELINEILDKYLEFPDELALLGTIYCHAGSTAEAYAIEYGMDYELIHFYEDEWHSDNGAEGCRWRKCIHCDEKEIIEHDMSDFVVTKEATCIQKGEKRADCANCDYFETKATPVGNHIDKDLDGYCDNCGEFIADKNCICICHAKTIGAFVYKLFKLIDKTFKTRLVYKVFDITDICVCGIKHI